MKKRVAALVLMLALLCTAVGVPLTASASYALPDTLKLRAQSAILVYLGSDAAHDSVMFERDADAKLSPSGLVRIMVGLYAFKTLEEQNMDPDTATGTYSQAVADTVSELGMITLGMEVGEVWRVRDLLSVSMLQTAADALTTLVTVLAGTQEAYVAGMNELAAQIGCTDTRFANVYGLDDTYQYTTARDVYRILRYASLNYPALTALLGQSEHTVHPVKGEAESWPSTNQLLRESSPFYYEPLVYGRSGYTETLGQSCASVARDEGYEYMAVVLGCPEDPPPPPPAEGEEPPEDLSDGPAFLDTAELFRWAYSSFSYTAVVSKNQPVSRVPLSLAWSTDSVALVAADDLTAMLRKDADVNALRYEITLLDEELTAPVTKGQVCGRAAVYDGEQQIGQFDLAAADSIGRSQLLAALDTVWRVVSSPAMLIVFGLLLALLLGYIAFGIAHNRRRRRSGQKRVKRYK